MLQQVLNVVRKGEGFVNMISLGDVVTDFNSILQVTYSLAY